MTITKGQALREAGEALTRALLARDAMSPRDAAEAAHTHGGPSVDELEARIIASRQAQAA